ncbi:MAG: UvrD-helicase domain-containing protein [Verrucomicrobia bacterium]|nr:UvrD-helicase domain-containing protein [Verrucomicrobiota bacterium]MBU1733757.1 UvrD-helicase domain-containing protein [Verrucomicrobiota bacterium]MBU1857850.1 UvrD-helicase domain-containing protein [Verrucomicrobiota bacterium]
MNIDRGKTSQAPDIQIRREALDTRRSFILEAPAGSGKTALLTARFLALLADVGHPRQILAVTFTRKAAAEMADRITRTLRQAQDNSYTALPDSWEARLLELARNALKVHPDWDVLLRSPDAFFVDTFHGFCGRVARNWPLEARTPPAFALLDEIGQEALLDEAVAEYVHAFAATRLSSSKSGDSRLDPAEIAAFQRRMVAANNSVRVISNQLADLLARRDRLGDLITIFRHPLAKDELERRTEQLAEHYLGRLHDHFARHKENWLALQRYLDEQKTELAEALSADIPGPTLRDVSAWQSAANVFLVKAGTPRKQFKPEEFGQNFAKTPQADFIRELPSEIAWILNFTREWPNPPTPRRFPLRETASTCAQRASVDMSEGQAGGQATGEPIGFEALSDCMRLARGALEHFGKMMNARGLDFMELELAALRAFNQADRPGDSLIFFHEHLRHILVDEAQDMNDNQVRILSTLTEGWAPDDGRTVFIVGDPKQSIFRFRRAEVSLFEALKANGLSRSSEAPLPLKALNLNANFRSRPHLVAFANTVFARVMATPNKAFDEVSFNTSEPARDEATEPAPITLAMFNCRHANNPQTTLPFKSEAREQEARYVAGRVAVLHRADRAANVAILIPARTHLTPYVRAMEALSLPIRLMEGVPMLDCPEVRHQLNLFKALLRPHDDIAWAGALRAPWCRVPAATLEKFTTMPTPARWSEKITGPGRQVHPEIFRFNIALDKIRPDFGRESYAISLQRLWEELGGPAAVVRMCGPAGLANSMRYLDLLDQCPEGRGEETLDIMERLLARAYTPPDPRAAFSPVAIMTIHKAKGLEFDHVFVVGLDREPGGRAARRERDAAFLMERLPAACPPTFAPGATVGRPSFLAATAGDRRTDARSLAQLLLSDLGLRRNASEYKRLIYVAATRARETLTLSGLMLQPVGDKERQTRPSAIAWLDTMDREGVLEKLPVQVLTNPQLAKTGIPVIVPPKQPPAPAPFEPEPLPYLIRSPSKIEDETATAARSGTDETDPGSAEGCAEASPNARARGVVMHRLFETLARGEPAPRVPAVAAALAVEDLDPEQCRTLAKEMLDECRRAWEFKALAALRDAATERIPEWAIEDCFDKKVIRIGRIDLVLKTAHGIVLVDFKTGRPGTRSRAGPDSDTWLTAEIARYRPQLIAYREMAARALDITPTRIQPVLFFTALLHWVDVG